jgi:hypothetical protein
LKLDQVKKKHLHFIKTSKIDEEQKLFREKDVGEI